MHKIIPPLFALLLIITFSSNSIADIRPKLKNRVGIPPFQVLKDIMSTNQEIKSLSSSTPVGDTPYLTWLADPDPRIHSGMVISSRTKGIYEIRNLANQLTSSLAAVDYGVRHLHSPILLITGNTDSEAIRLFARGYKDLEQSIRLELDHLYLPLAQEVEKDLKKEKQQDKEIRLVEANVDYQAGLAAQRYRERIKAGRLFVVGGVLDIGNHYGMGSNSLIIINVNGEKDAATLKKMRIFKQLDPKMLQQIGRKAKTPAEEKGAKK